MPINFQMLNPF